MKAPSAVKSLFKVTAEIREHFQDTEQTLDLDDGVAAGLSCAASLTSVFDKKIRRICNSHSQSLMRRLSLSRGMIEAQREDILLECDGRRLCLTAGPPRAV